MEKDKQGKESTALAVTLANDKALGEIFVDSGLFKDTKDKNQAIVKILAGREIGLQPIESMTGLNIFSGKISIGGNVMASKVKANPKYNYRVTNITDEECVIDFFEGNEKIGTSSFTLKDAEKAHIHTKDNWKNWPRNMMFNRALSNGVRWYCPDVFGCAPVYTPDELGVDVDEDDKPINVTPPKSTAATSFKQCSQCGNAIPKDNESGLCVNCTAPDDEERPTIPPVQEAEYEDVNDEPEPEEDEEPIIPPGIECEYDDDHTVTLSIPDNLIDDTMRPRDALSAIIDYATEKGIGNIVKPVIVKHYKKYDDGSRYPYHIPESKVIKIVEELTGIRTKKAEKVLTCKGKDCKSRVTEAEAYEQKNGRGQSLCLDCWKKEND